MDFLRSNSSSALGGIFCLKCINIQCDKNDYSFCQHALKCFASQSMDSKGEVTKSKGCLQTREQSMFLCRSSNKTRVPSYLVECCDEDYCNNGTIPSFPEDIPSMEAFPMSHLIIAGFTVLGFIAFMVIIGILIYVVRGRLGYKRRTNYKKQLCSTDSFQSSDYRDHLKVTPATDSSLREMFTESLTSGSGSGLPLFVQRTLSKNITLEQFIGKGSYGEVWRGVWQGETVAVKIFFSRDEASWARETEIYSSLIRHENVLGFYGSDMTTSEASCTQLWLVTHYHPIGSLYDFLTGQTINVGTLLSIWLSCIKGLLYLHTETGLQGKPPIAHGDIRSKNILMKKDGTFCLADFGEAIVYLPATGEINFSTNVRPGTWRYRSPEIIEQRDMTVFEQYRQSDIYSLSLVLWESCSRLSEDGSFRPYRMAYASYLPDSNPTIGEVRKIVCEENLRPEIPEHWEKDTILSSLAPMIKECWSSNPNIRLTTLRLRKNVMKIVRMANLEDDDRLQ